MRVLDLGSGMGDMALVAAELVGSGGQVLGIDRSPAPVEKRTCGRGGKGSAMCGSSWATSKNQRSTGRPTRSSGAWC
ncbi:MAG: hypothetical protein DLM66_12325 [Candidatus Dormiibacter spiritus]|nr:MAG: hypothetical protein DLM66_12325 [Candidatus Dormibacteraeota bacterium]